MEELDLYKYIHDEDGEQPDISWFGDELGVFIHPAWVDEWYNLLSNNGDNEYLFDDGGIQCRMVNRGYFWFNLTEICEYAGIDPTRILPKERE